MSAAPKGPPFGPPRHPPWADPTVLDGLAFVTLWTTGPDPARDRPFRLQAIRRGEEPGTWTGFDRLCDPFDMADEAEPRRVASRRMVREFGLTGADLVGAPPAPEALAELLAFLGNAPVVLPAGPSLRAWAHAIDPAAAERLELHELGTLAALLTPGREASLGEDLAGELLGLEPGVRRRALGPLDLRAALRVAVGRALEPGAAALALIGHVALEVQLALGRSTGESAADRERAERLARELALGLTLLERPSLWMEGAPAGHAAELYAPQADGALSRALRAFPSLGEALDAIEPPWAGDGRGPSLSPVAEAPAPLDRADRRAVDEVFEVHLPRRLAPEGGEPSHRPGQHALAARLAESFGERELLLLHAPTGTGKTLAYLVPCLLWAYRNATRIGVATFTRALQEQAMERDVPLALEMLRRVGVRDARVALLKGRRHSLCWRALVQALPQPGARLEDLLAWLVLARFASLDPTGDLDRLSLEPPLGSLDRRAWSRRVGRAMNGVRAATGCCSRRTDRITCGAEAARRRAERAHLVITNHAFAMARREYFRHLVFDECEHLHDVAHDAFSHAVGMRELRAQLDELVDEPQGRRRGRLLEVLRSVGEAGAIGEPALACLEAGRAALAGLAELEPELERFEHWRRERGDADPQAGGELRLYVDEDAGTDLLRAQAHVVRAMYELDRGLEVLVGELEESEAKGAGALRRPLEIRRGDLAELRAGLEAWVPRARDTGAPLFGNHTFHDLERAPNQGDVLAARVLLPNEHLGRHYYPELAGAALLSATTFLKGGFETASTYLGLARAAQPAEEEEREPCHVTTFRAPEVFDYGRVLVAVPRDAPSITADKPGFLDYAARFLGYLAERTRGRVLALFTNGSDLLEVARHVEPFFAARHLPFGYQGMSGASKEELGERFRARTDSVLFGLDTFWYGADFPGETLEYLVLVRLPYGVPDRYHHAQCAALGVSEQRRQIYMPRSLAKFRQGFGRLMRRETDRGCVFVLDKRILDPRHRVFLRELPVRSGLEEVLEPEGTGGLARFVNAEADRCFEAAFKHMDLGADLERRGLAARFTSWELGGEAVGEAEPFTDVATEDLPF